MTADLHPSGRTEAQRVLDRAARRILAERLREIPSHNDHDPAGNRAVEKASDDGAHRAV